ncbi:MAG: hypothetical protein L6306_13430, partial [Planctomycetales bacterium]|nr:hypothetical protein [Planctomycetales bacterium]
MTMDAPNPKIAELEQLLWRMRDGAIDDDGLARIETLVTGDAEVRRFYIRYSTLCGGLRWLNAGEAGQRLFSPPAVENAPSTPFPSLSTTRYPLPATDFVGSWTFACMVATVIVGAMILGAWAVKVTHHQHFATAPSKSVPSDARPEFVFVGRITGLLDVKWSDDKDFLPPHGYAYVPLGHKYKLDS